ncbi:hypothetical protein OH687_34525 [Burkholderia anthina]|nr:hypothetical protein OH687_34525 [Burkholderia anthina]
MSIDDFGTGHSSLLYVCTRRGGSARRRPCSGRVGEYPFR